MEGKNLAMTSMVCGIISTVCVLLGTAEELYEIASLAGIALGIVAIVLAVKAKKRDYSGGIRNAGFVLGIIGTSLCGMMLLGIG